MRFDSKIALVLRQDLETWQKLNVAAFLASAVAASERALVGAAYEDGSGVPYLAMFRQPVLVFAGDGAALTTAARRAAERNLRIAVYTSAMFATGHDEANRAAVKAVPTDALDLVGIALHAERKLVDKVTKGLALHP